MAFHHQKMPCRYSSETFPPTVRISFPRSLHPAKFQPFLKWQNPFRFPFHKACAQFLALPPLPFGDLDSHTTGVHAETQPRDGLARPPTLGLLGVRTRTQLRKEFHEPCRAAKYSGPITILLDHAEIINKVDDLE